MACRLRLERQFHTAQNPAVNVAGAAGAAGEAEEAKWLLTGLPSPLTHQRAKN